MKKIALCLALAPLAATAGCGGYYGGVGSAGDPIPYDGYYDGYYGPIYDGYWGNDGNFWWRHHPGGPFRPGGGHFGRQPGWNPGGPRIPMRGNLNPAPGMRMPHFGGGGPRGMHPGGPGGGGHGPR